MIARASTASGIHALREIRSVVSSTFPISCKYEFSSGEASYFRLRTYIHTRTHARANAKRFSSFSGVQCQVEILGSCFSNDALVLFLTCELWNRDFSCVLRELTCFVVMHAVVKLDYCSFLSNNSNTLVKKKDCFRSNRDNIEL